MKLSVNRAKVNVGFKPNPQALEVVVGIPETVKTSVEQKAIVEAAAISKVAHQLGMNPDLFFADVITLDAREFVEAADE